MSKRELWCRVRLHRTIEPQKGRSYSRPFEMIWWPIKLDRKRRRYNLLIKTTSHTHLIFVYRRAWAPLPIALEMRSPFNRKASSSTRSNNVSRPCSKWNSLNTRFKPYLKTKTSVMSRKLSTSLRRKIWGSSTNLLQKILQTRVYVIYASILNRTILIILCNWCRMAHQLTKWLLPWVLRM